MTAALAPHPLAMPTAEIADTAEATEAAAPNPREEHLLQVDVARWREEIVRLREMFAELEGARKNLIWFVWGGLVIAVPSAFYHLVLPPLVMLFFVTCYVTGLYFSWGHLVDRRGQLKWAHARHREARQKLGLPAEDETLRAPKVGEEPRPSEAN